MFGDILEKYMNFYRKINRKNIVSNNEFSVTFTEKFYLKELSKNSWRHAMF